MTELKGEEHGLLVLKDSFSTFCWLHPCASFNARNVETAVLLWASVFYAHYASHRQWHAFQKRAHNSSDNAHACMHHCTTPYAHWAHGASERVNRTIVKVFRVLLAENSTDYREWVPLTPLVQASINQHVSLQRLEGLREQVMLGRDVPTPLSRR